MKLQDATTILFNAVASAFVAWLILLAYIFTFPDAQGAIALLLSPILACLTGFAAGMITAGVICIRNKSSSIDVQLIGGMLLILMGALLLITLGGFIWFN